MENEKNGEIIIYQSEDGVVQLDVRLENEMVWLTIDQMSLLFGKAQSPINEHILNAFQDGELNESDSVRKIGNSDFSTNPTNYYNLDVIISVGYHAHSIDRYPLPPMGNTTPPRVYRQRFSLDDKRL